MNNFNILKIALAILLLLCLADMPYGFFMLVRTSAMIVFAILAYDASKNKKETEVIIYIGLAILFQPIFKIALGRELWNIVDVIVALGLIYTIYDTSNKK